MDILPVSRLRVAVLLVLVILLTLTTSVNAQEVISLDEVKIGQLSGAAPVSFSLMAPPGLSIHVEVIGATPGLAPQFSIYTASDALVQTVGNPSLGLDVEGTLTLPQPGVYRIDVSSVTGATGQFIIRVTLGTPPTPAIALAANVPVSGTVAANQHATYSVQASPQGVQTIEILTSGVSGLSATLSDASGATVGMFGGSLVSGKFDIPAGQAAYQLDLTNDGSASPTVGYQLILVSSATTPPISTPPAEVTPTPAPIVLPSLPSGGACVLATSTATLVNIRAGGSTE